MPHRRELDNTGIEPEHIKPFRAWLRGQTVPITEEGRIGYYRFDYERWKESKGRLLDEEVQQEEHHD